jgi:transposase-like protein
MRNILAKFPRLMQVKMKGVVRQVFLAPTYAAAAKRGRDLIARFKDRYSAAMECLERDSRSASRICGSPTRITSEFARRTVSSASTEKTADARK